MLSLLSIILLHSVTGSCTSQPAQPSYASVTEYCILPQDEEDEKDVRWSTYLHDHLHKRIYGKHLLTKRPTANSYNVYVDMDTSLGYDYEIQCLQSGIRLKAHDKEKMLWLLYQFMSCVGKEDTRIVTSDLPPATIDMEDLQGNFPFEYRGLYTPHNADEDMFPILGTNNVDYDWGLWGHNLSKILSDTSFEDLYALVKAKRDKSQFCFSSEHLYQQIVAYIIDNYGDGKRGATERFAILPNDNDIVCVCDKCLHEGNTPHNATPASSTLITRLAYRFPNYQFFLSAYRTTAEPPFYPLPPNVGVLISAMNLPMTTFRPEQAEVQTFTRQIQKWKNALSTLYIWDYIRNFDDYLSPYPYLHLLQHRLQYYQRNGIKGIFLNGSGYDYASFDDLQTYVSASLLTNPDQDINSLVDSYLQFNYPCSYEKLAAYYKGLEQRTNASSQALPFYGGIQEAENVFLDYEEFCRFYELLPHLITEAPEEEQKKLIKLYTALSFTRLELARTPARFKQTLKDSPKWIKQLSAYTKYKDMQTYREAYGEIDTYIKEWEDVGTTALQIKNGLAGRRLPLVSATDCEEKHISLLTDEQYAFTSDYHLGWQISKSKEWGVELPTDLLPESFSLQVSFLHCPKWRIFPPENIHVCVDGNLVSTTSVTIPSTKHVFQRVVVPIKLNKIRGDKVELKFIRPQEEGVQVACDEILWKK